MSNPHRKTILRNCKPNWRHQDRPQLLTAKGWTKLNPTLVLDLIEDVANSAHPKANWLLDRMRYQTWSIHTTAQADGKRVKYGSDAAPELSVQVGGRPYRLYVKSKPRLRLTRVTA